MASVTKTSTKKSPRKETTNFNKDKRRKHHHFLVTVYYADGEKFGRVYTDKDKADRFADRQKRSPVVKSARVSTGIVRLTCEELVPPAKSKHGRLVAASAGML